MSNTDPESTIYTLPDLTLRQTLFQLTHNPDSDEQSQLFQTVREKSADEKLDEKILDAEKNLGESEVRLAHLEKSNFLLAIGRKVCWLFNIDLL